MIGPGMHHDALFYASDEQFVTDVGGFVVDGVRSGERTIVVEPPDRIDLLRSALGADAAHVEFFDMTAVGGNPARIIAVWAQLLTESLLAGRRLRGVGEPAFAGRTAEEFVECRIHEQLLNEAFGVGSGWNLLCPYDRTRLPPAVVAEAQGTHPFVVDDAGRRGSAHYCHDATAVFAAPLAAAPQEAHVHVFGGGDLPSVRASVATFAADAGYDEAAAADLVLAASELAANSVEHGGGRGVLSMWRAGDAVCLEFADDGVLRDPLAGRLRPPSAAPRGRGLYLANHLCDLVQIRSGEGRGTRVRAWLRRQPAVA